MPNQRQPNIGQWYRYLGKGQQFYVTAIDEKDETIEVQHFDGDLEEFSFEQWPELDIDECPEPESWSGAVDIAEKDDFGTEVTDTQPGDWTESESDFKRPIR